MAGLLDFSQYVGGNDNLQTEQAFPSTQRTVVYNFAQDITGWTFYLDYQTVVANSISYSNTTGAPNFSGSQIIGYFPSGTISTSTNVQVIDASSGTVAITFPGGLYTGGILPDARSHTPITVVGVTWTDNSTPPQINTHRWAFVMGWEPGVAPADPILDPSYVPITIGG